MKDKIRKKTFLLKIALISMVFVIILTAISAIAGEMKPEKYLQTIIVGTELNYPPYSYLDEKGIPTGYNIDITKSIARVMGLNVDIQIGPWGDIRKDLGVGKIDVISGMYYSKERDKIVDFSPPYTIVHHAIFARADSPSIKSEDKLRGREIIVMRGDIMHDYVLENRLSENPVLVSTPVEALKLLASGKHDYALLAKLPGLYWIRKLKLPKITTVGPLIRPSKYCFAFSQTTTELLSRFSEGLAIIKETGEYKEIYDNWLGILEPQGVSKKNIFKYLAMILIPLLLLLVGSVLWSQSLKKKVLHRTREFEREANERKQAENELRKSEERYRTILESIEDGYYEVDIAGNLTFFNDSLCEMFGYSKSKLLGMNNRQYTDEENAKGLYQTFNKVYKTGNPEKGFDWEIIAQDGTIIHTEASVSLRKNLEGQPIGFQGIVRDVSERKRRDEERINLESQLQRAQKMEAIGILAGGIAHDLNNVLSGIVSYPELLLLDMPEDSPLRKPISTIQKSGQKATDIVQDLLTLARRGVVATEVMNLNQTINSYLKSPECENLKEFHPDVKIESDLETNLLNIVGSPVHLSKTVMNLVSNAAEAMPDGGRIFISTENLYIDRPVKGYDRVAEGDYVTVTVTDTGIGISEEDLKRIFEPFYTKKIMGRSGTGLGMAVVWGTVKDHKGYIDLKSTKGKGTTFTLYFPVTREELPMDEPHPLIEDYMGKGESILVIDDVEEQREIASGMLKKLDYSVTAISSGEEAIEYMKDNSADLLILDMIMDPGIDGLETYKKILKLHPKQKAVIASGFSETDRVKETKKLGVGQYIKKPYVLEEIGLAVKEELGK